MKSKCPFFKQSWWQKLLGKDVCTVRIAKICIHNWELCEHCCARCIGKADWDNYIDACLTAKNMDNIEKLIYYNWKNQK